MLLTPQQASEIVGVPAVQLCRWAVLKQGPRNSGTKHKPMYDEDDLKDWLRRHIKVERFNFADGSITEIHREVDSAKVLAGNAFFQMIKRA